MLPWPARKPSALLPRRRLLGLLRRVLLRGLELVWRLLVALIGHGGTHGPAQGFFGSEGVKADRRTGAAWTSIIWHVAAALLTGTIRPSKF